MYLCSNISQPFVVCISYGYQYQWCHGNAHRRELTLGTVIKKLTSTDRVAWFHLGYGWCIAGYTYHNFVIKGWWAILNNGQSCLLWLLFFRGLSSTFLLMELVTSCSSQVTSSNPPVSDFTHGTWTTGHLPKWDPQFDDGDLGTSIPYAQPVTIGAGKQIWFLPYNWGWWPTMNHDSLLRIDGRSNMWSKASDAEAYIVEA